LFFLDTDLLEQRALIALLALLLSLFLGGWLAHITRYARSVNWLHQRTSALLDKLNKPSRSAMTRAMRGALMLIFALILAYFIGHFLNLLEAQPQAIWVGLHIGILAILLRASHGFWPLWKMGKMMHPDAKHFDDALLLSQRLHGISLSKHNHAPDNHGMLRLAILQSFAHITHTIIGSLIGYLLGGFMGLLLYRAVRLLTVHAPQTHPDWRAFGLLIHWLARGLFALPTLFALGLCSLASLFVSGANIGRALRVCKQGKRAYLAALLSVSLGGKMTRYGIDFQERFIGKGTAKSSHQDAARASGLFALASAFWLLGLMGLDVALQHIQ
jgi:cobalamin biosynthesis protein CobD/CbiB